MATLFLTAVAVGQNRGQFVYAITGGGLPKITPKIAKESHGKFRVAGSPSNPLGGALNQLDVTGVGEDARLLAHELAHVVQQKGGKVPTARYTVSRFQRSVAGATAVTLNDGTPWILDLSPFSDGSDDPVSATLGIQYTQKTDPEHVNEKLGPVHERANRTRVQIIVDGFVVRPSEVSQLGFEVVQADLDGDGVEELTLGMGDFGFEVGDPEALILMSLMKPGGGPSLIQIEYRLARGTTLTVRCKADLTDMGPTSPFSIAGDAGEYSFWFRPVVGTAGLD